MISAQLREATLEVDLAALRHNLRTQLKQIPGAQVLAVVKANAYGNGLIPVATCLNSEPGIAGFCVAMLDEGRQLRDVGIEKTVLVLGITPVKYAPVAAAEGVSLAVGDLDWLRAYRDLARVTGIDKPLRVHLALDTGMGRIGFTNKEDLAKAVELVQDLAFDFEGIFTHFSTADSGRQHDTAHFAKQVAKWDDLLSVVKEKPRYVHVANSATALWHQDKVVSKIVRMGISLYGCNPSGSELAPSWQLAPVTSLTARLTFVKKLAAGEAVSYGATYVAKEDEWVGTVPVGYADGYCRGLTGYEVLINGQRCPILGRICMDQFMVRLPEKLPVGTRVVLLGKSGDEQITATDLADQLGTINYEVLTNFNERLRREYRG